MSDLSLLCNGCDSPQYDCQCAAGGWKGEALTADSYEADIAAIYHLGWEESQEVSHDRCRRWFRYFAGEPECRGNEGKRLQIQLRLWDWRIHGGTGYSFDLAITAEPPGSIGCVELKAYSITNVRDIEPNVDRLLRAWRACQ